MLLLKSCDLCLVRLHLLFSCFYLRLRGVNNWAWSLDRLNRFHNQLGDFLSFKFNIGRCRLGLFLTGFRLSELRSCLFHLLLHGEHLSLHRSELGFLLSLELLSLLSRCRLLTLFSSCCLFSRLLLLSELGLLYLGNLRLDHDRRLFVTGI